MTQNQKEQPYEGSEQERKDAEKIVNNVVNLVKWTLDRSVPLEETVKRSLVKPLETNQEP